MGDRSIGVDGDPDIDGDRNWDTGRRVLASPRLVVLMPGDRFWPLLVEAVVDGAASGNLAFDAQIVALCREAGVRALLTDDRDFGRFADFPTLRL